MKAKLVGTRALWVHHPESAKREAPGIPRFVVTDGDDNDFVYEGEDFVGALASLMV